MTTPTTITTVIRTLDQLLPGQTAVIKQIGGRGDFRRRMSEVGLTAGAVIEMLSATTLGDPIEYLLNGRRLLLRRAEARVIVVEL
ncbi:MAG: ferrous iron transport protein A [Anaerolineae bacterium]|nr:ferrous iron transport protein A [Anaerolineae bacterium]